MPTGCKITLYIALPLETRDTLGREGAGDGALNKPFFSLSVCPFPDLLLQLYISGQSPVAVTLLSPFPVGGGCPLAALAPWLVSMKPPLMGLKCHPQNPPAPLIPLWIKLIFYVLLPTDLFPSPCLACSPGLWLFHLEASGRNIPLGAALHLAAPVGFFFLLLPKIPL